ADQRGPAVGESRDAVSGAAEARTGRLDRIRVGDVGEQSTRALLSPHASGPPAFAGRGAGLGADGGDHRAVLLAESGGSAMRALRRFVKRLTSFATSRRDEARLRE